MIFSIKPYNIKSSNLNNLLIYLFIFFFIYTASYKLININAFKFNIARTAIFPESFTNIIPYFVIFIELFIVTFLLFKKELGVKMFAICMAVFSMYITTLFYYGRYEVCECGGVLHGLEFKYHLIINLAFLLLSVLVIYLNITKQTYYEK